MCNIKRILVKEQELLFWVGFVQRLDYLGALHVDSMPGIGQMQPTTEPRLCNN